MADTQSERKKIHSNQTINSENLPQFQLAAKQGDMEAQYTLGICYFTGVGVERNYEEAFKWFQKAAKQGHAEAQGELGVCYYNGEGIEKNFNQAVTYYKKAAMSGNLKAQYNLGFFYFATEDFKNYKESFKWFKMAADNGMPQAQYRVGMCYFFGHGVVKDSPQAFEWLKKAAGQGDELAKHILSTFDPKIRTKNKEKNVHSNPITDSDKVLKFKLAAESDVLAQYNLGVRYSVGDGVAQSYEEAFSWFEMAASQGDERAQYNLATCYSKGLGVTQNYEKAFEWFKKAAEKGDRDAQCNLGICYFNGDGVAKNYPAALWWFKNAAEQGDEKAQYNLGSCYLKGQGVAQNFTEAFKWSQMAAEKGHAGAQCNLGFCYFNGRGIEKNFNQAVKCYTEAAEKGHIHAQYSLGICYYFSGSLEEQNYQKAFEWFKRAADKGDADAQFRLGLCFYLGHGVEKDHSESFEWFKKSAEQDNATAKYLIKTFGSQIATTDEEKDGWLDNQGQINTPSLIASNKKAEHSEVKTQSASNLQFDPFLITSRGQSPTIQIYSSSAATIEYESINETIFMADTLSEKKTVSSNQIVNSNNLLKSALAAEPSDAVEQCNLGLRYFKGDGVAQNYIEAFRWFKKAADQGDGMAQSNLGACYSVGYGVEINNKEAFKWFEKAADQGDEMAQCNVGACYFTGEGVTQNYKKAFKWLIKAAEQGEGKAQYQIGFCYSNGYGVTKNSKEAFRWYQKAADQGNEPAKNALKILHSKLRTTEEEKKLRLNKQEFINTPPLIDLNKKIECSEVEKKSLSNTLPKKLHKEANFLRSIEQRLAKISEDTTTIKDIKNIKVNSVKKTEQMHSLLLKNNKQLKLIKRDLEINNVYVDYNRYEKIQIALKSAEMDLKELSAISPVDVKINPSISPMVNINGSREVSRTNEISKVGQETKKGKNRRGLTKQGVTGPVAQNEEMKREEPNRKVAAEQTKTDPPTIPTTKKLVRLNESSNKTPVSQKSKEVKNSRRSTDKQRRMQIARDNKNKRDEAKRLTAEKEKEIKQRQAAVEQIKTDPSKILPLDEVESSSDDENDSVNLLDEEPNSSIVSPLKKSSLTFFPRSAPSSPVNYNDSHSPEEKKKIIANPLLTDPISSLPSELELTTGTEDDKRSQSPAPEEKKKNIVKLQPTHPIPTLPPKLNLTTGTEDDKGSQFPIEKTNKIAESLPYFPVGKLSFKLYSSNLNLTSREVLDLDLIAELQEALPSDVELRLNGSLVLGEAVRTVLGARCFIPSDFDVHINLSKREDQRLSVYAAIIKCGFVLKPNLSNDYWNFFAGDPNRNIDLSVKLTNKPDNFNPFLLTSATMGFKKLKKNVFCFSLNSVDASRLKEWLFRGMFPIYLPDSRDQNVRHFLYRFLNYTSADKNKLIIYYMGPRGPIYNLDYYFKIYFYNLLRSGNISHLHHHYQSIRKSIERNLFSHPAVENIIYNLCLAHLNVEFWRYSNAQIPALNMAKFLQNYFIDKPMEANQFSIYLKELIKFGPGRLNDTLFIASVMMKHLIEKNNFLESPKYISFCCSCALAQKYPKAVSKDLQLASVNMTAVLIGSFKYINEKNLLNCMKELSIRGIAFLADANNIKILTDEISGKPFIDPKNPSESMKFSHSAPFNHSPSVNFSYTQEHKKKQSPDGGPKSDAPIPNTFNPL